MNHPQMFFVADGWWKRISARIYATATGHPYHSGRLPARVGEDRSVANR